MAKAFMFRTAKHIAYEDLKVFLNEGSVYKVKLHGKNFFCAYVGNLKQEDFIKIIPVTNYINHLDLIKYLEIIKVSEFSDLNNEKDKIKESKNCIIEFPLKNFSNDDMYYLNLIGDSLFSNSINMRYLSKEKQIYLMDIHIDLIANYINKVKSYLAKDPIIEMIGCYYVYNNIYSFQEYIEKLHEKIDIASIFNTDETNMYKEIFTYLSENIIKLYDVSIEFEEYNRAFNALSNLYKFIEGKDDFEKKIIDDWKQYQTKNQFNNENKEIFIKMFVNYLNESIKNGTLTEEVFNDLDIEFKLDYYLIKDNNDINEVDIYNKKIVIDLDKNLDIRAKMVFETDKYKSDILLVVDKYIRNYFNENILLESKLYDNKLYIDIKTIDKPFDDKKKLLEAFFLAIDFLVENSKIQKNSLVLDVSLLNNSIKELNSRKMLCEKEISNKERKKL